MENLINKFYLGNNVEILKTFPQSFIDLTVTSPPYDGIRNYNKKLNTEELNFNGYSFPFEDLAKELYRVTKEGGVVVWVVADETVDNSESGNSFRQVLYFKECGFKIHDTMIYEKTGISFPSKNRYNQSFEYMFILSKGKPKTTNLIKDKENIYKGSAMWGKKTSRKQDDLLIESKKSKATNEDYGIRNNFWRIKNSMGFSTKDKEAHHIHPAIFPESLAHDHIKTWSNEGDIVLDPFSGSGTTAKMAKILKRKYIGIDINKKYIDFSEKRLEEYGNNDLINLFGDDKKDNSLSELF